MAKVLGIVAFTLGVYVIHGSPPICIKDNCYGSMQELSTLEPSVTPILYYIRPDNFTGCNPRECLSKLRKGIKLECRNSTVSLLKIEKPWSVPTNVHLKPSCRDRQVLRRVSLADLDWNSINLISATKVVLQSGHAPCSLLDLCNSNCSIESFDVDNQPCTREMKTILPQWFSAPVSLLTTKPTVTNVFIGDIGSFTTPAVLLHISSRLGRPYPVTANNVSVSDVFGGSVQIDSVTGHLRISNVSHLIENVLPSEKEDFTYDNVTEIVNVYSYTSMRQILIQTTQSSKSTDCVEETCKVNTLYAVTVPIFLTFLLVCTCLWKGCTLDKNQEQEN
jgi:hypothetical protein